MENWQLAIVIILATFVGACIPAIIQLMMALKSLTRLLRQADGFVRGTGHTLERALLEATELAGHVNRAGSTIESGAVHIKSFFEALEQLTDWLHSFRRTLGLFSVLGATIAPSVGEAIRAAKEADSEAEAEGTEAEVPSAVPVMATRIDHQMKEEMRS